MLNKSLQILLLSLVFVPIASAGVLGSRIEVQATEPTQLNVGDTINVSVLLDGFEPNAFGIWRTNIELPSFLSLPTNVTSTFTFSFAEITASPPPSGLTGLGANSNLSVLSLGLTRGLDAMLEFETTVLSEGQGSLNVDGSALMLTPSFDVTFASDLTTSTYVGTASSAATQSTLQAAHTPEPSSALIFLPLSLAAFVRRRPRAHKTMAG